ncbi:unnamed protein product [Lampetra planeri]
MTLWANSDHWRGRSSQSALWHVTRHTDVCAGAEHVGCHDSPGTDVEPRDSDEGGEGVVVQRGWEFPQRLFVCPSRHFAVREEAALKGHPVTARRHKLFKDGQMLMDGRYAPR